MASHRKTLGLLLGVAGAALSMVQGAHAQQTAPQTETPNADEIVVLGQIQYRNRTEGTAPVLEYGLDYFQRFEPLTAGDALKRVPSVAFLSDVIESDGVRLRGLDPAYTQILINGEQVPGAGSSSGAFGNGAEQSFFVDRIPAELIERVEIVRSASANRSGDALAGAINIVLRDAYALDGGFVRAGGLYFDDGALKNTLGGVYGGQLGPGRFLLGANLQDRYNPKVKRSTRFNDPVDGDPVPFNALALTNTEAQTDTRDGTDYSFNGSYQTPFLFGDLTLDGFWVRTQRYENEDSTEFRLGIPNDANLLTLNDNNNDIDQQSWSANAKYAIEAFGGETRVKFGYASFLNKNFEFEDESEFLRDATPFPEVDRFTGELSSGVIDDEEVRAKLEHSREIGALVLEVGVHYESKIRKSDIRATTNDTRLRVNQPGGTQSRLARPAGVTGPAATAAISTPGGDNTIERTRIDPYVQVSAEMGAFSWEAGLRLENTDIEIDDRTLAGPSASNDYQILLPSAHVQWNLTENDRITASAARTVRNPSFSFLSPATLIEELGDNDFVGTPNLDPEQAWGVDIGYERRLGRTGIAGVNVFYRDVTDVLEVFNTGAEGDNGPGTFVYSARNTGDGQVYGIEFDLSTPLTFVGLENTGVFLNYSWLDSKLDDEFGERTFNDQAEFVFNVGFIQDLPSLGAAFGATYRKQGDAFSRVVGEEVTTEYGADLEAFLEKRIGKRFTVRFVGSNLLDAEKAETFNKFLTSADQRSRLFDEYELENEKAGPVYQLIGRLAF